MPSNTRLKTYERSKKIETYYTPKPVSPFKITGASTVIDALFSKNIKKRKLSKYSNHIKKKTRGRTRETNILELPAPVYPMLNNDSLNVKINSTFDDLLQGPVYNQVNICNKSSLYVDNSTDTSNSMLISKNVKSSYNIRKKKQKNYAALHSGSSYLIDESHNKSVLPAGKIRKRKNNPRKLKQVVKNVVINISDTTTDKNISKKLHSYLDHSINYSLIIDRQSKPIKTSMDKNVSYAKKFTPIAPTSKLLSLSNHSNHKQEDNIFRPGFRQLMRADNTPRFIHSSTPIVSKKLRIHDKLNVSPINAKSRLNFTSSVNKSLYESKKIIELSSIQNTNNDNSVILINSTIPETVQQNNMKNESENIINDTTDNYSVIPIRQNVNIDEDNIISEKIKETNNIEKNVFITDDIKLNGKAIVRLENNLDVLGINRDTRLICTFSNSRYIENDLKPVVRLEKVSVSKYLKNSSLCKSCNASGKFRISSRSQSIIDELSCIEFSLRNSKSQISTEQLNSVNLNNTNYKSVPNIDCSENMFTLQRSTKSHSSNEHDTLKRTSSSVRVTKRVTQSRISNEESHSKNEDKFISNMNYSKKNSKPKISITSLSINKHDTREENYKVTKKNLKSRISVKSLRNTNCNSKISTNLRSSELFRDSNEKINQSQNSVNKKSDTNISKFNNNENSNLRKNSSNTITKPRDSVKSHIFVTELSDITDNSASMFESQSINTIENSVTNASVPKNFITTRKKREQINIEIIINQNESKESTKPPDINSKEWDRFFHSRVNLIRMEECEEMAKYSNVLKINENTLTKRKEESNDFADNEINRKSIFLKAGKQWFRSLSILRRTNIQEIDDKYCNKGRKWHDSVCEVLEKQNDVNSAVNEIGNESVVNDMKFKIKPSIRATLGIRKSLKIVNLSIKECSILAEGTTHEDISGYVSTLAHVSILESFDKLSLSANIDDREETARQIILKRCGQTVPIPFDDCYSSRILKKCRKIGEGVYGEVFMYKSLDDKCRVMKVIPIEGNLVVNGERQKKFEEIISEIVISSELSNLRINNEFCTNGFTELLQVYCVQGKYPQHLLELWDLFDEQRGSENDSPEIFNEDQLYVILELANGGQDLESFRFNNAEQAYALFVQVVCSLAVAESALQFEHRDMHWGNVLISPTDEATTTFRLKGRELEVATRGVKVSIIDFTLSRMTYNNCCILNDLGLDPDLFTATGDYQFEIYRLMKQRNQNDWQVFEPYTNILWLDYTLEKMIGHVRYFRVTTKTHKTYIRRLSQIQKKILSYNSATELLNSDVFSQVFL